MEQSASRWQAQGVQSADVELEGHAFRAALQVVLERHHPLPASASPAVGRVGKTSRRQRRGLYRRSQVCPVDGGQAGRFVAYSEHALQRLQLPCLPEATLVDVWREVEAHVVRMGWE